jgi:hypothetical protein
MTHFIITLFFNLIQLSNCSPDGKTCYDAALLSQKCDKTNCVGICDNSSQIMVSCLEYQFVFIVLDKYHLSFR